jgi:hypothetical protein
MEKHGHTNSIKLKPRFFPAVGNKCLSKEAKTVQTVASKKARTTSIERPDRQIEPTEEEYRKLNETKGDSI